MSKLLIYYTRTGSGDLVSKKCEELGFDLRKVESKYKLSNNGIQCYSECPENYPYLSYGELNEKFIQEK